MEHLKTPLMKLFLPFFLLMILFTSCSSLDPLPDYAAEVDAVFANWDNTGPGGAIGIIKNGQLEYAKGYGLANLEYDISNTPQSVFRIASVSKQFTAACIVLLAEEGKLSLEDKLSKFYPQLPAYADSISILHLLNHTSGLRDYLQLAFLSGLRDDDFYTDEELMGWFVRQKSYNFPAGNEFLYCNTGYWLLGQIVQEVSGMNMADYARENIFDPLGMSSTHFHNENTRIVKNRASGYTPTQNGFRIDMTQLEMIGDGAIFTTVEDMAKWDENFYSHKVGSQDFHNQLETRAILNNGDTLRYAKGLDVRQYKGKKVVGHGGSFVGFNAFFQRFPDDNISIVLLTNRGDSNPNEMVGQVADILFDLQEESSQKENTKEKTVINLEGSALQAFAGQYWDASSNRSSRVTVENDTLKLDGGPLLAVGEKEFIGKFRTLDMEVNFDGSKMNMILPGFRSWEFEKYQPANYSKQELEQFAGTFHSEELRVSYDIKMQEDELVLFVDGREISGLSPVKRGQLMNPDFGLFEFSMNGREAKSFALASGRVKNLFFERVE